MLERAAKSLGQRKLISNPGSIKAMKN